MRDLVRRKLAGQGWVLEQVPGAEDAADAVARALEAVGEAATVVGLLSGEAAAAAAYCGAWAAVPVRFVRKDADRMPEHWRSFGARTPPLTGSPRNAANPANALLNYLYAVLETEARIAVLTVGLDPGLGVLHADQRARDSLVHDLMEPVRPYVDRFLLELLQDRVFAAREFHETRIGTCRLLPPLPQSLAETSARWAGAIAPIAEQVARALFDDAARRTQKRRQPIPTPLTGANRSAGWDAAQRRHARPMAAEAALPATCRDCGSVLGNPERSFCDDCLPERTQSAAEASSDAGLDALASLREAGTYSAHGGDAARKRGERNARHAWDAAAWERENPRRDPEDFVRDILPDLQGVSLSAMMEATDLSVRYCSLIRRGSRIPHPRHWALLVRLASVQRQ